MNHINRGGLKNDVFTASCKRFLVPSLLRLYLRWSLISIKSTDMVIVQDLRKMLASGLFDVGELFDKGGKVLGVGHRQVAHHVLRNIPHQGRSLVATTCGPLIAWCLVARDLEVCKSNWWWGKTLEWTLVVGLFNLRLVRQGKVAKVQEGPGGGWSGLRLEVVEGWWVGQWGVGVGGGRRWDGGVVQERSVRFAHETRSWLTAIDLPIDIWMVGSVLLRGTHEPEVKIKFSVDY